MNMFRWNYFALSIILLGGGSYFAITSDWPLTSSFFAVVGIFGTIVFGMPIWKKIFKRKEKK